MFVFNLFNAKKVDYQHLYRLHFLLHNEENRKNLKRKSHDRVSTKYSS